MLLRPHLHRTVKLGIAALAVGMAVLGVWVYQARVRPGILIKQAAVTVKEINTLLFRGSLTAHFWTAAGEWNAVFDTLDGQYALTDSVPALRLRTRFDVETPFAAYQVKQGEAEVISLGPSETFIKILSLPKIFIDFKPLFDQWILFTPADFEDAGRATPVSVDGPTTPIAPQAFIAAFAVKPFLDFTPLPENPQYPDWRGFAFTPDARKLMEYIELLGEQGGHDVEAWKEQARDFMEIQIVRGEAWIGRRDFYLHRLELSIHPRAVADGSDTRAFERATTLALALEFFDFNRPRSCDRPLAYLTFDQAFQKLTGRSFDDIRPIFMRDGASASPAMVASEPDADNDGLPDFLEQRLGTDLNRSDTDGDGYSDSDEFYSGHNPRGEGRVIF